MTEEMQQEIMLRFDTLFDTAKNGGVLAVIVSGFTLVCIGDAALKLMNPDYAVIKLIAQLAGKSI